MPMLYLQWIQVYKLLHNNVNSLEVSKISCQLLRRLHDMRRFSKYSSAWFVWRIDNDVDGIIRGSFARRYIFPLCLKRQSNYWIVLSVANRWFNTPRDSVYNLLFQRLHETRSLPADNPNNDHYLRWQGDECRGRYLWRALMGLAELITTLEVTRYLITRYLLILIHSDNDLLT